MNNLFNTIILFMFIYNIAFKGIPSILSTGKVAFLIICVCYLFKIRNKTIKYDIKKITPQILVYVMIVLYAFIIFIFNKSSSTKLLGMLIYYILFAVFLPLIYKNLFIDKKTFLKCFINATFIQSIFIVISFISRDFRVLSERLLVNIGNISLLSNSRVAGFTNGASATLSLIQGLGLISLIFYYKNRKNGISAIGIFKLISLFLSIFFTGKTGLIVVGIMLIFIFIEFNIKGIIKGIISFTIIIICIICTINVIDSIAKKGGSETIAQLDYLLKRNLQVLDIENDSSLNELKSMTIPKLEYKTIIGTGQIYDDYGYNASGHDSGYIQFYYALGLPMAIIFYINVLIHFIKSNRLNSRFKSNFNRYILGLVVVVFIVECKEPFISKQILPFYIFMLQYTKETTLKNKNRRSE